MILQNVSGSTKNSLYYLKNAVNSLHIDEVYGAFRKSSYKLEETESTGLQCYVDNTDNDLDSEKYPNKLKAHFKSVEMGVTVKKILHGPSETDSFKLEFISMNVNRVVVESSTKQKAESQADNFFPKIYRLRRIFTSPQLNKSCFRR